MEILSYALHKKQYPEDTIGIVDKKIKLLRMVEQDTSPPNSNIQLSEKKGIKVNFIRVINTLCELSFFTDRKGNASTKKEIFKTLGNVLNQDFTTYQIDLTATKAAAKADQKNTLLIFEQMYAKQLEINAK